MRWAKRSKKYFEAHKEEVPWFRHSPFAIRSSPETRLNYQAHPSRDGTSTGEAGEQIPRFARDDNQETIDDKHGGNGPSGAAEAVPFQSSRRGYSGEGRMANSEERVSALGQTQTLFGIVQGGMLSRSAAGISAAHRRTRLSRLCDRRAKRRRAAAHDLRDGQCTPSVFCPTTSRAI